MRDYRQFYINGQWVNPAEPHDFDVINPATEEVCAKISLGTEADVNKAVAAAKTAFESYSRTSRQERVDLECVFFGPCFSASPCRCSFILGR